MLEKSRCCQKDSGYQGEQDVPGGPGDTRDQDVAGRQADEYKDMHFLCMGSGLMYASGRVASTTRTLQRHVGPILVRIGVGMGHSWCRNSPHRRGNAPPKCPQNVGMPPPTNDSRGVGNSPQNVEILPTNDSGGVGMGTLGVWRDFFSFLQQIAFLKKNFQGKFYASASPHHAVYIGLSP